MCTHHQTALPAAIYLASRASVCGLTVQKIVKLKQRHYRRCAGIASDPMAQ
jgi:hypothetical protein